MPTTRASGISAGPGSSRAPGARVRVWPGRRDAQGHSGAGLQPHRESHSRGTGGCQYQAGIGGYGCTGCIRPADDSGRHRRTTGRHRAGRDVEGAAPEQIPELKLALMGRVTEHHQFLPQEMLDDLRHVESKMSKVEAEIEKRLRSFQDEVARLCTIPGVDWMTAWGLLSEIGSESPTPSRRRVRPSDWRSAERCRPSRAEPRGCGAWRRFASSEQSRASACDLQSTGPVRGTQRRGASDR